MDRADISFGMVVLEGLNAVALVKFRKNVMQSHYYLSFSFA